MGRIWLACRAFWLALFSARDAQAIRAALQHSPLPESNVEVKPQQTTQATNARPTTAAAPKRSEAVTLLAALQREARFVDLVKEPLDSYTDEQIGAAARNVLRDCGGVLDRFFELKPAVGQAEGESVEVPVGYDPARYKVTGNVNGSPPFRGRVVHAGWVAATANLPAWTGNNESAKVVAPVEVEV
jgi:hypothetical protein